MWHRFLFLIMAVSDAYLIQQLFHMSSKFSLPNHHLQSLCQCFFLNHLTLTSQLINLYVVILCYLTIKFWVQHKMYFQMLWRSKGWLILFWSRATIDLLCYWIGICWVFGAVCSVQFLAVLLFLKLHCSNTLFICELLCILKVILTFCVIVPLQNPWLLNVLVLELKLPICVFCIVEYVHLCLIMSIFSSLLV